MNTLPPSPTVAVLDWGRTDYATAFERQKALVDDRRADRIGDTLVLTEHDPVYTIGLRKDADQHLVWTEALCAKRGIQIVRTNRGGDITYHGPGQIVGYAILSLRQRKDLHAFLRDIESVAINTLATFGLTTDRREGKTGIWVDTRKICAIGVAVRSWITYHGFALNVNPDLAHFSGIVPCGITDGTVTSLQAELGHAIDVDVVKARLAVEFQKVFEKTARPHG